MNEARLASDQERINRLAHAAPGILTIERSVGKPPREYVLRLKCRGLGSVGVSGPTFIDEHTVHILLGPDYPFEEPDIEVLTPSFHPHIFSGGSVCLGGWTGTEYLDHLVKRLFRILQYDPDLIDETSVANGNAMAWARTNASLLPLGRIVPGEQTQPAIRFRAIT